MQKKVYCFDVLNILGQEHLFCKGKYEKIDVFVKYKMPDNFYTPWDNQFDIRCFILNSI